MFNVDASEQTPSRHTMTLEIVD